MLPKCIEGNIKYRHSDDYRYVALSEEELSEWTQALKDPEATTRRMAAYWPKCPEDPQIIPPLIEALQDPDLEVCRAAAHTLQYVEDSRALDAMLLALQSPRPELRRVASFTLADATEGGGTTVGGEGGGAYDLWLSRHPGVGDALSKAMDDEDPDVSRHATLALVALKDERALEALLRTLENSESDYKTYEGLASFGGVRAVEPLIRVLGTGNSKDRRYAAEALGKLGDVRAVAPLLSAVEEGVEEVRWAAIQALGDLHAAEAVEPLCRLLEGADHELAGDILSALGDIGNTAAVDVLIEMMASADWRIRGSAVIAITHTKDTRVLRLLIRAVDDCHPEVREWAIRSIMDLDGWWWIASARVAIQRATRDPDNRVRQTAVEALGKLGLGKSPEILTDALLDSDGLVSCLAAITICNNRDELYFEPLVDLLQNERSHVRWLAATVLGNIGQTNVSGVTLGHEEVIAALEEAADSDVDSSVRQAARTGADQIRSELTVSQDE